MIDERLQAALRALAVADQDREAPPEVEARLRARFRHAQFQQRTASRARRRWITVSIPVSIAAAALLAVGAASVWRGEKIVAPQTPAIAVQPAPVQAVPAVPVVSAPEPQVRVASATPRVPRPRHAAPREVTTDFFPLVDYAPPFERGQLVRVSLPASAMRAVGLPVREERLADRVQADVLVGQEGLARAIRFVSYSQ